MRRQAVVQRQRIALVFQQNARAEFGNGREAALQFLVHRRGMGGDGFAIPRNPHFRTVAADRRKLLSGAKIRSMSFSERPLTRASAPEVLS